MWKQKEAQNAMHLIFRQCDISTQGFGFLVGTSLFISVRNLLWVAWVNPTLTFNSEVSEGTGGTLGWYKVSFAKFTKYLNSSTL